MFHVVFHVLAFLFVFKMLFMVFHFMAWGRRHRRWSRRRGQMSRGLHRAAGEVLKRRLDIDDDQEGIVDHALADLRGTMRDLKDAFASSRQELADAFAAEEVDDAALTVLFAQQDEELARARRQAVSAFKQIHAVLDHEQREQAARLLAEGPGRRFRGRWGAPWGHGGY